MFRSIGTTSRPDLRIETESLASMKAQLKRVQAELKMLGPDSKDREALQNQVRLLLNLIAFTESR